MYVTYYFAFTTQPNTHKDCGMGMLASQPQDIFCCHSDDKLTTKWIRDTLGNDLHAPKPDTKTPKISCWGK